MAKSRKEKKQLRKERQEQLHEMRERVEAHLRANNSNDDGQASPEVQYTYADEPGLFTEEATNQFNKSNTMQMNDITKLEEDLKMASSLESDNVNNNYERDSSAAEVEDERVVLPELSTTSTNHNNKAKTKTKLGSKSNSANDKSRKHHKLPWQTLKVMVADKYGNDAAELVGEHDGNSEDPLFTVLMKMRSHSVPVPSHWDKLRSFLANQADRESAVGVIPAEVEALGVEKIRATKDKKANVNQMAFITCFMTGTPLQTKTFDIHCSPFGDIFHEGKWMPKSHYTPGVLSSSLRQALGMGALAPPPWLYQMQYLRRLPPAYPTLRIAGLNAPIPAGAQWGKGQGQWGEAPRNENNAILFPGVMDEAFAASYDNINSTHHYNYEQAQHYVGNAWGTVPVLRSYKNLGGGNDYTKQSNGLPSAAQRATRGKLSQTSSLVPTNALRNTAAERRTDVTDSKVHINPVPFHPQSFSMPSHPQVVNRDNSIATPLEFVRVEDQSQSTTVTVGHVLVPKTSHQQQQQQQQQNSKKETQVSTQMTKEK